MRFKWLWLDDVRPMPKGFHSHAKTVEEAQSFFLNNEVSFISFDHDLGEGKTGYDLAKWLEDMVMTKGCLPSNSQKLEWVIHSANPVGRANIEMAMRNVDKVMDGKNETF